jgi:hypothetical protein
MSFITVNFPPAPETDPPLDEDAEEEEELPPLLLLLLELL